MICEQVHLCIRSAAQSALRQETGQPGVKAKNQPRKEKALSKGEDGADRQTPCRDPQRAERCIEYADRRSKCSCKEEGKAYTLDLENRRFPVVCMHVDGGVIDSSQVSKCDYLLALDDGEQRTILIELKGKNIRKAAQQLCQVLELKGFRQLETKRLYGRIVGSGVPKLRNSDWYFDLQKQFRALGGNVKIREHTMEEKYSDIDRLTRG